MSHNQQSRRIGWIVFIKGMAIFLMLYGHCIQYFLKGECFGHVVWSFIYSFHMPLFIMVSGYFAPGMLDKPFREVIRKTVKSYVLPMAVWTTIGLLLFVLPKGITMTRSWVQYEILSPYLSDYWFLKELSVALLLCHISTRLCKGNVLTGFFLSMLYVAALPMVEDQKLHLTSIFLITPQTLNLLPFFYLGILLKLKPQVMEHVSIYVLAAACLALLPFWSGYYTVYNQPMHNLSCMFMHGAPYSSTVVIYRYAVEAAMCLLVWKLAMTFAGGNEGGNAIVGFMKKAGKQTLGIYVMQRIVVERLLPGYINMDNTVAGNIAALLIAIGLTWLLYAAASWLEGHHATAWMTGGRKTGNSRN